MNWFFNLKHLFQRWFSRDPIDPNSVWQERRVIPVAEPLRPNGYSQQVPMTKDPFSTNWLGPTTSLKTGRYICHACKRELRPGERLRPYRGNFYDDDCYFEAVQIFREETSD